jgi:hypothetical protein
MTRCLRTFRKKVFVYTCQVQLLSEKILLLTRRCRYQPRNNKKKVVYKQVFSCVHYPKINKSTVHKKSSFMDVHIEYFPLCHSLLLRLNEFKEEEGKKYFFSTWTWWTSRVSVALEKRVSRRSFQIAISGIYREKYIFKS